MPMKESGEMYLETIYILKKTLSPVRSVDVANYTGYAKPSISRAMGILRAGGFIEIDREGSITLTEDGEELAARIYERHVLLSQALRKLGVPEKIADEDACRIEHDISAETFEILKKHIKGAAK